MGFFHSNVFWAHRTSLRTIPLLAALLLTACGTTMVNPVTGQTAPGFSAR
jgi:outer membrane biogenesis lipoprotein LolB